MIYLDGGGVIPDQPLADHTRLRIRLTDNPADDVSVYVEDGRLHIAGQYARLCVRQVEPHRVSVETVATARPAAATAPANDAPAA